MADYEVLSERKYSDEQLQAKVDEYVKLSDRDPNKYKLLTEAYTALEQSHHAQRQDYLGKVDRGRAVRRPDPHQPAFSAEADMLRANGVKSGLVPAERVRGEYEIASAPQGEFEVEPASKSVGEVYQSHRPDWNAPPIDGGSHPASQTAARGLNALRPALNVLQEIAAPLETLGDYARGAMSPETVLPGLGREGSYAGPMTPRKYNPSIDQAVDEGDPVTAFVREMATGLLTNPAYIGLSPMLRATTPLKPLTKPELDIMAAEESMGLRAEEIQRHTSPTPVQPLAGIGLGGDELASTQGLYNKRGTGRFMLPGEHAPSITDLAARHQAGVLEGSRTGAFYGEEGQPVATPYDYKTPARTDRLLGAESELPDQVMPFDKPRALRSAEEILQEKQRLNSSLLHGKSGMSPREVMEYVPVGPSHTVTEGAGKGAQQALHLLRKRDQARLNRQAGLYEHEFNDFATEYVTEVVAAKKKALAEPVELPGGQRLPKTFDHLSAESLLPSVRERAVGDVLTVIGEFSPAWKGASDSIRKGYEVAARQSAGMIEDYKESVANLFGRRGWFARKARGAYGLTEGENVAIHSSQRALNITPEIEEAAYNYLYTKGQMLPSASLSMANREKAIRYAELTYEKMLKRVAEHPGVRQVKIRDPFTGDEFEPGLPSMYVAHQPIRETTKAALKDNQWAMLYARMGGEERTKLKLEQFIERVVNHSKRDPEVGVGMFNMPNLEQKRMLDLSALGGSPYQHAKRLGYETDIYAMAVRQVVNGNLRGELQLLKPGIDALYAVTTGLKKPGSEWLQGAVNYAMKVPHGLDQVHEGAAKGLLAARRIADMTLLPKMYIKNMAQFAYPLTKAMGTPVAGTKANVMGSLDYLFGKVTDTQALDMVKRSGALLPSVINEFSHPVGPLATFHANVMKSYGASNIDRNTRLFAGHIGHRYVDAVANWLLKNPTSKVHAGILDEMGGPGAARTILQEGKVNDALRLEMIQRFANNTAGILDARGLPWYATSENPYAKAVLQYKPFLAANGTEIHRIIKDSPTKAIAANRLLALGIFGSTAGVATYEAGQLINHLIQGQDYQRPKKDAAYALEAAVAGMTGLWSVTLLDLATDPMHAGAATTIPSLAVPAGFARDIHDTIQYGPGWRTIRQASKLPVIGGITGTYVQGRAREESRRRQEAGED